MREYLKRQQFFWRLKTVRSMKMLNQKAAFYPLNSEMISILPMMFLLNSFNSSAGIQYSS